jgi:hypothetical protein
VAAQHPHSLLSLAFRSTKVGMVQEAVTCNKLAEHFEPAGQATKYWGYEIAKTKESPYSTDAPCGGSRLPCTVAYSQD